MDEALTIPFYKAFDAKKIVFDTKPIVFDAKTIAFDAKPIVFDAKPIVFDAKPIAFCAKPVAFGAKRIAFCAKTVAFDAKRIVGNAKRILLLFEIAICGIRIYSQKQNPLSTPLRPVSPLRRRPPAKRRRCLCNKTTNQINSRRKYHVTSYPYCGQVSETVR